MTSSTKVGALQPWELAKWMRRGKRFILIDVLPKEIYKQRRIPGALNACV
jgi:rhodanese-related sulfurtransferase